MSIEVLKVDEWLSKEKRRSTTTLLEQLNRLLGDMAKQVQHESKRPYRPFEITVIKPK
jgi:hypothetical protein